MVSDSGRGWRRLAHPVIGLTVAGLISFALSAPANSAEQPDSTGDLVDSLVVKYEPGASIRDTSGDPNGADLVKSDVELSLGENLGLGYRTIKFDQPIPVEEAKRIASQLDDSSAVAIAEPNYVFEVTETIQQDLNSSKDNWGLDRIDQTTVTGSNTYSFSSSGVGVKAYVVDTGIRLDHSEFTTNGNSRIATGWTAINDGLGTRDCIGHGTHVAGIIGGNLFGVAKNVTLVPVRVLDCSGSGTSSDLIAGINWIISDHQAGQPAVANFSLGSKDRTGSIESINQAITALIADGVQPFVASGNSDDNACFYSPANSLGTVTVNAATLNDTSASFSNYGSCTDIYAPGVDIRSAAISSSTSSIVMSGTSMATPFVTGAAANILQENSGFSPNELVTKLFSVSRNFLSGIPNDASDYLYQPANGWNQDLGTSPATVFGISNNYIPSNEALLTRTATLSPSSQTISGSRGATISNSSLLGYENMAGQPTFSVSPTLPDGLTLNNLTGVISGTPTYGVASEVFTITGTSSGKSATSSVTINISGDTKAQVEAAAEAARIAAEQQAAFNLAKNTLTATASKRVISVRVTAPAGSTTAIQIETSVRQKVPYQKAYKVREKYTVVSSLGKTVTKYRYVTRYRTAYRSVTVKVWKTVNNSSTTTSYSWKAKKAGIYRVEVVTPFGTTATNKFRVR